MIMKKRHLCIFVPGMIFIGVYLEKLMDVSQLRQPSHWHLLLPPQVPRCCQVVVVVGLDNGKQQSNYALF